MSDTSVLLAEVTRRDEVAGVELVESVHHGHVVVTVDGAVAFSLGVADRPTFHRSAVKPVQAAVCLEVLGEHGWPGGRPTAPEIAIGWASHRAEDVHLDAVRALAGRAGITPELLTCPPDVRPLEPQDGLASLHHNCSGKHALFALTGRAMGLTGHEVLDREAPLQRRNLDVLEDVFGPIDAVAVDGCGAPAVRSPLSALATGFGRLASEERWAVVREAAFAHPVLVAGTGWLDTALLGQGIVAKRGAEGVRAAGWVADGASIGIALKVEDGADRGADAALAAVVSALGRSVGDWVPQTLSGGGREVGRVRAAATFVEALAPLTALG